MAQLPEGVDEIVQKVLNFAGDNPENDVTLEWQWQETFRQDARTEYDVLPVITIKERRD